LASHPEGFVNDAFCSDRSGHIFAGGNYTTSQTFWVYDTATGWARIPDLPSGYEKGDCGSCTVTDDGWLYTTGGGCGIRTNNTSLLRIQIF